MSQFNSWKTHHKKFCLPPPNILLFSPQNFLSAEMVIFETASLIHCPCSTWILAERQFKWVPQPLAIEKYLNTHKKIFHVNYLSKVDGSNIWFDKEVKVVNKVIQTPIWQQSIVLHSFLISYWQESSKNNIVLFWILFLIYLIYLTSFYVTGKLV